jgi:hypothetical protein
MIPNCIVEDCGPYFIVSSLIFNMKHKYKILKYNLNIDKINDFHDSFKYITDFLSANNFEVISCTNSEDIYYNTIIPIRVDINLHGYFINYAGPYKSQKFLEIMREKLVLNDVNKLVVKE